MKMKYQQNCAVTTAEQAAALSGSGEMTTPAASTSRWRCDDRSAGLVRPSRNGLGTRYWWRMMAPERPRPLVVRSARQNSDRVDWLSSVSSFSAQNVSRPRTTAWIVKNMNQTNAQTSICHAWMIDCFTVFKLGDLFFSNQRYNIDPRNIIITLK